MVCSSSNLHVTHFTCEQSHERKTLKRILCGFSSAAPCALPSLTTLAEARPAVSLDVFLRSHKELQIHCLQTPADHPGHQTGCPQCHRKDNSWSGKQLALVLFLSRKGSCHPPSCKEMSPRSAPRLTGTRWVPFPWNSVPRLPCAFQGALQA